MTSNSTHAPITLGFIGLGVMGQNLALNLVDHDVSLIVWNRDPKKTARFVGDNPRPGIAAAQTLAELVSRLPRPRTLFIMVEAGAPVDSVLAQLQPLLAPDDLVIDGGNSWFLDTRRRERELATQRILFFGLGVSGGEEGARHGPSLMPGGTNEAYHLRLAPVLEAIAARTDAGPCVTWIGPDGAGHFAKMVHNGIEYGDMQLIAEVFDLLRQGCGLSLAQTTDVIDRWRLGPLASYLLDVTARVLHARAADGSPLLERVADRVGQKGTGRWTVASALELGVPVPTLAAAVDARLVSSRFTERWELGPLYRTEPASPISIDAPSTSALHDALLAGKIIAYAQGFELLAAACRTHQWPFVPAELARIWQGGCIIRARLLDVIRQAFLAESDLPGLLHAAEIRRMIATTRTALRTTVAWATQIGRPIPALSASLGWLESLTCAHLPLYLTAAQRDAFGAHLYYLRDEPDHAPVHSDWTTPE